MSLAPTAQNQPSCDRHHIALRGHHLGFDHQPTKIRQREENAMTEAELVSLRTQVMQLQQQADHQAQAWRKLGKISGGFTLFLAVMAFGFFVAGVWSDLKSVPAAHDFAQTMGFLLLFTSLPFALLAQALQTR
jgi:hypothetical protein